MQRCECKLVEAGNKTVCKSGFPFIVVLGHPEYYPRFGFVPAGQFGFKCEWDVPDNVFMIFVFDQGKMANISGLVKYRPEFSSVEQIPD